MAADVATLIQALKAQVPFAELRPASTDTYLEAVVAKDQLAVCESALTAALGAAVKPFGQGPKLDRKLKGAVDRLGGVRQDQCLYLQPGEAKAACYALLWPWGSDPNRVTLKVGTCTL
jgi:hypothetical protein